MLEVLLFVAGSMLVLVVALDVVQTTLSMSGSGPLTRRVNLGLWRAIPRRERMLACAGPTLILLTTLVWFFLFWLGWCLMFAADSAAVVADPSGDRADLWSRVYYVGFTIITLGVGDYTPNGPLWQLLTVLAAASGFFLVTLVITYLLPLVSAVVEQRQLAAYIHSLGDCPAEILRLAWNGKDYAALGTYFVSLAPAVHRQSYLHLAYPVLHYFRSAGRRSGIAPAIATLDDTLTLLLHAVPDHQRPTAAELQPLRRAITALLQTLDRAYIASAKKPPTPPRLPWADIAALPPDCQERRRLLAGWLADQGWPLAPDAPAREDES